MKKGFTCGAFDLLHAGHVLFLKECKKNCDWLIVGLQIDPSIEREDKNKPVQSVLERQIQLQGCKHVDEIVVYETEEDLRVILSNFNYHVRFLGDEYAKRFLGDNKQITAEEVVPIKFIERNHSYSSSKLRERIKDA